MSAGDIASFRHQLMNCERHLANANRTIAEFSTLAQGLQASIDRLEARAARQDLVIARLAEIAGTTVAVVEHDIFSAAERQRLAGVATAESEEQAAATTAALAAALDATVPLATESEVVKIDQPPNSGPAVDDEPAVVLPCAYDHRYLSLDSAAPVALAFQGATVGAVGAGYGYLPADAMVLSDELENVSSTVSAYCSLSTGIEDAAVVSVVPVADGSSVHGSLAVQPDAGVRGAAIVDFAPDTTVSAPTAACFAFERDWNAEWTAAWEKPATTASQRLHRTLALHRVSADFASACEATVRTIVDDLMRRPQERQLRSANVGGIAGGEKFISGGIFFKFARDWRGLYGGDEFAMKAAALEINNMRVLMRSWEAMAANSDLNGTAGAAAAAACESLRVPLATVLDFAGFRVLALGKLPIGPNARGTGDTLVYGSADAAATVKDEDPAVRAGIDAVASWLNLKKHSVGAGAAARDLSLCADIEVHHGRDGRRWVVDTARVFPPEAPTSNLTAFLLHAQRGAAAAAAPPGVTGTAQRLLLPSGSSTVTHIDINRVRSVAELAAVLGCDGADGGDAVAVAVRRISIPGAALYARAAANPHIAGAASSLVGRAQHLVLSRAHGTNHIASAVLDSFGVGHGLLRGAQLPVYGDVALVVGERGQHLYSCLRRELLLLQPLPVSSDAFSQFCRVGAAEHNTEVRSVTQHLMQRVLPALAEQLCIGVGGVSQLHVFQERDVVDALHAAGVNMRFAGVLRVLVGGRYSSRSEERLPTTARRVRGLLMTTLVTRVLKQLLRHVLRSVHSILPALVSMKLQSSDTDACKVVPESMPSSKPEQKVEDPRLRVLRWCLNTILAPVGAWEVPPDADPWGGRSISQQSPPAIQPASSNPAADEEQQTHIVDSEALFRAVLRPYIQLKFATQAPPLSAAEADAAFDLRSTLSRGMVLTTLCDQLGIQLQPQWRRDFLAEGLHFNTCPTNGTAHEGYSLLKQLHTPISLPPAVSSNFGIPLPLGCRHPHDPVLLPRVMRDPQPHPALVAAASCDIDPAVVNPSDESNCSASCDAVLRDVGQYCSPSWFETHSVDADARASLPTPANQLLDDAEAAAMCTSKIAIRSFWPANDPAAIIHSSEAARMGDVDDSSASSLIPPVYHLSAMRAAALLERHFGCSYGYTQEGLLHRLGRRSADDGEGQWVMEVAQYAARSNDGLPSVVNAGSVREDAGCALLQAGDVEDLGVVASSLLSESAVAASIRSSPAAAGPVWVACQALLAAAMLVPAFDPQMCSGDVLCESSSGPSGALFSAPIISGAAETVCHDDSRRPQAEDSAFDGIGTTTASLEASLFAAVSRVLSLQVHPPDTVHLRPSSLQCAYAVSNVSVSSTRSCLVAFSDASARHLNTGVDVAFIEFRIHGGFDPRSLIVGFAAMPTIMSAHGCGRGWWALDIGAQEVLQDGLRIPVDASTTESLQSAASTDSEVNTSDPNSMPARSLMLHRTASSRDDTVSSVADSTGASSDRTNSTLLWHSDPMRDNIVVFCVDARQCEATIFVNGVKLRARLLQLPLRPESTSTAPSSGNHRGLGSSLRAAASLSGASCAAEAKLTVRVTGGRSFELNLGAHVTTSRHVLSPAVFASGGAWSVGALLRYRATVLPSFEPRACNIPNELASHVERILVHPLLAASAANTTEDTAPWNSANGTKLAFLLCVGAFGRLNRLTHEAAVDHAEALIQQGDIEIAVSFLAASFSTCSISPSSSSSFSVLPAHVLARAYMLLGDACTMHLSLSARCGHSDAIAMDAAFSADLWQARHWAGEKWYARALSVVLGLSPNPLAAQWAAALMRAASVPRGATDLAGVSNASYGSSYPPPAAAWELNTHSYVLLVLDKLIGSLLAQGRAHHAKPLALLFFRFWRCHPCPLSFRDCVDKHSEWPVGVLPSDAASTSPYCAAFGHAAPHAATVHAECAADFIAHGYGRGYDVFDPTNYGFPHPRALRADALGCPEARPPVFDDEEKAAEAAREASGCFVPVMPAALNAWVANVMHLPDQGPAKDVPVLDGLGVSRFGPDPRDFCNTDLLARLQQRLSSGRAGSTGPEFKSRNNLWEYEMAIRRARTGGIAPDPNLAGEGKLFEWGSAPEHECVTVPIDASLSPLLGNDEESRRDLCATSRWIVGESDVPKCESDLRPASSSNAAIGMELASVGSTGGCLWIVSRSGRALAMPTAGHAHETLKCMGVSDSEQRVRPFRLYPLRMLLGKQIASVSCGSAFTALLDRHGAVYTFGENSSGALGHGDTAARATPQIVRSLDGVRVSAIATGMSHMLASCDPGGASSDCAGVTCDTILWAWGNNAFGCCGVGHTKTLLFPAPVTMLPRRDSNAPPTGNRRISKLACSADSDCTAVVTSDGLLFRFGDFRWSFPGAHPREWVARLRHYRGVDEPTGKEDIGSKLLPAGAGVFVFPSLLMPICAPRPPQSAAEASSPPRHLRGWAPNFVSLGLKNPPTTDSACANNPDESRCGFCYGGAKDFRAGVMEPASTSVDAQSFFVDVALHASALFAITADGRVHSAGRSCITGHSRAASDSPFRYLVPIEGFGSTSAGNTGISSGSVATAIHAAGTGVAIVAARGRASRDVDTSVVFDVYYCGNSPGTFTGKDTVELDVQTRRTCAVDSRDTPTGPVLLPAFSNLGCPPSHVSFRPRANGFSLISGTRAAFASGDAPQDVATRSADTSERHPAVYLTAQPERLWPYQPVFIQWHVPHALLHSKDSLAIFAEHGCDALMLQCPLPVSSGAIKLCAPAAPGTYFAVLFLGLDIRADPALAHNWRSRICCKFVVSVAPMPLRLSSQTLRAPIEIAPLCPFVRSLAVVPFLIVKTRSLYKATPWSSVDMVALVPTTSTRVELPDFTNYQRQAIFPPAVGCAEWWMSHPRSGASEANGRIICFRVSYKSNPLLSSQRIAQLRAMLRLTEAKGATVDVDAADGPSEQVDDCPDESCVSDEFYSVSESGEDKLDVSAGELVPALETSTALEPGTPEPHSQIIFCGPPASRRLSPGEYCLAYVAPAARALQGEKSAYRSCLPVSYPLATHAESILQPVPSEQARGSGAAIWAHQCEVITHASSSGHFSVGDTVTVYWRATTAGRCITAMDCLAWMPLDDFSSRMADAKEQALLTLCAYPSFANLATSVSQKRSIEAVAQCLFEVHLAEVFGPGGRTESDCVGSASCGSGDARSRFLVAGTLLDLRSRGSVTGQAPSQWLRRAAGAVDTATPVGCDELASALQVPPEAGTYVLVMLLIDHLSLLAQPTLRLVADGGITQVISRTRGGQARIESTSITVAHEAAGDAASETV